MAEGKKNKRKKRKREVRAALEIQLTKMFASNNLILCSPEYTFLYCEREREERNRDP